MSKPARQASSSSRRVGAVPAPKPRIVAPSHRSGHAGTEPAFPQARFLGVSVHAMTVPGFHRAVEHAIKEEDKCVIAHHNLHSMYLLQKEMAESAAPGLLERFYRRARWVQADGMSMILFARLHGFALHREHRIAHNTALPLLLDLARANKWRVLYLGSSPQVSVQGSQALREALPGLDLGAEHGFFPKEPGSVENKQLLDRIAAFAPHILFVGMGMPRQEQWIEENFDELRANVIVTSGATLDYFAGALPMPPPWMGRVGLEWLFRLLNEPRRLGFRYLGEPCLLLAGFATGKLRRRKAADSDEPEQDFISA